jgi:hypothetical protein
MIPKRISDCYVLLSRVKRPVANSGIPLRWDPVTFSKLLCIETLRARSVESQGAISTLIRRDVAYCLTNHYMTYFTYETEADLRAEYASRFGYIYENISTLGTPIKPKGNQIALKDAPWYFTKADILDSFLIDFPDVFIQLLRMVQANSGFPTMRDTGQPSVRVYRRELVWLLCKAGPNDPNILRYIREPFNPVAEAADLYGFYPYV